MSIFELLSDEREEIQRLGDALSDLLAMCPFVTMAESGAEPIWNRLVAAAQAIMKLTETTHDG